MLQGWIIPASSSHHKWDDETFSCSPASFPVSAALSCYTYSSAMQKDERNSEKENTHESGKKCSMWDLRCSSACLWGRGPTVEGRAAWGGGWALQLVIPRLTHLFPPFFGSPSLLFPFWHMPNVLPLKPALLKGCKTPSCCKVRLLRTHLHLFSVAALITHNKGI